VRTPIRSGGAGALGMGARTGTDDELYLTARSDYMTRRQYSTANGATHPTL
jgi:hypothetical protein